MKLSTPAAIILAAAGGSILKGAAARSTVSPLSGINLFPRANFEVEVDAAQRTLLMGLDRFTDVMASPIQQELDTNTIINAAALDEGSQEVQTLRLTETSWWHTDHEMDGPQQQRTSPKKDQLQVGLFFSNTNNDAYFETKDGDLCIPIVEGNFVSFNGRVHHRTVVKRGHIDMVGPFSLSSDVLLNVNPIGSVARPKQRGRLEVMAEERRQLSAQYNSSTIDGDLVMGDMSDSEEYGDHFLALNATGLPSNCTNDCGIAIAMANSHEGGNTNGWFDQFFDNVEIENSPISLSEVLSMVDAAPGLMMDSFTNAHVAPVVYLYDKEKVPVACAYLEPLTEEEKKELNMIFNGDEEDSQIIEDEGSDATAAAGAVDVAGSGSVAVVPTFVVGMITACALVLLSL